MPQNTFLYADDEHFTSAGQKIVADYIYSLVIAPSQISFLAEAPVKSRLGLVSTIQTQMNLSNGKLDRRRTTMRGFPVTFPT